MRHVAITTSFPPPRKIPAPYPPSKVNLYYLNVADPLILIFKFASTQAELTFCTGSDPARDMSDLQW